MTANEARTGEEDKRLSKDFIRTIIEEDIASGKADGRVQTRFPSYNFV